MRKRMILLLAAIFLICSASVSFAATYYLSTSGSNLSAGTSETTAWKTFAKAFSNMRGGDALILLNGTYSASNGTGYINYDDGSCSACAQPPSGVSMYYQTSVSAKNPGMVVVDGGNRAGLFLGRSFAKNSYVRIEGIKFEGGGSLFNTSYVTVKNCGFHSATMSGGSVFGIGANDHTMGNTYNLIEDCWIWGQERVIAINYRSDYNIWRRVVVRGDGCSGVNCLNGGSIYANPNVGFSIYDSAHNSIQNMIVIDRVLSSGANGYADFATAQHSSYLLGPNEWLGCISLNSPDSGFYFEADSVNDQTHTLRNCVAWNSSVCSINISNQASNVLVENITTGNALGDNVRFRINGAGILRNVIAYKSGRYGVNSEATNSYCNVYGSAESRYYGQIPIGDKSTNPLTDGSLKYITRIEAGSPLKGTGYAGKDYGANVINRYGLEGSRHGDPDYNTLTTAYLWPWTNEARIKADMAVASARGFCDPNSSLTMYVWGQLGYAGGYSDYGTSQPPTTTTPPVTTTASPVVTTAPPATTIPPTTTPAPTTTTPPTTMPTPTTTPPTTTPAPTTTTPPTTTSPSASWTFCAKENRACKFSGIKEVRYGAKNTYVSKTLNGPVSCNNATFGDPLHRVRKHCDYR